MPRTDFMTPLLGFSPPTELDAAQKILIPKLQSSSSELRRTTELQPRGQLKTLNRRGLRPEEKPIRQKCRFLRI
jgi:hypothetical protein